MAKFAANNLAWPVRARDTPGSALGLHTRSCAARTGRARPSDITAARWVPSAATVVPRKQGRGTPAATPRTQRATAQVAAACHGQCTQLASTAGGLNAPPIPLPPCPLPGGRPRAAAPAADGHARHGWRPRPVRHPRQGSAAGDCRNRAASLGAHGLPAALKPARRRAFPARRGPPGGPTRTPRAAPLLAGAQAARPGIGCRGCPAPPKGAKRGCRARSSGAAGGTMAPRSVPGCAGRSQHLLGHNGRRLGPRSRKKLLGVACDARRDPALAVRGGVKDASRRASARSPKWAILDAIAHGYRWHDAPSDAAGGPRLSRRLRIPHQWPGAIRPPPPPPSCPKSLREWVPPSSMGTSAPNFLDATSARAVSQAG